jgi:hypothetical protein
MSKAVNEEVSTGPAAVPAEQMTIKGFKSNADIETFYRFIHENGLRREAHMLMEYAMKKVSRLRKSKKVKTIQ